MYFMMIRMSVEFQYFVNKRVLLLCTCKDSSMDDVNVSEEPGSG